MITLLITGPHRAQTRYASEERDLTFGRIRDNHVALAVGNAEGDCPRCSEPIERYSSVMASVMASVMGVMA